MIKQWVGIRRTTIIALSLGVDPTVPIDTVLGHYRLSVDDRDDDARRPPRLKTPRWRQPFQIVAALLLMALAEIAGAQTANGVIAGTVSDTQGGVLPGVTLTIRSAETGAVRTAVTEGDGRYRVAGLPPGAYSVSAELEGFGRAEVKSLTLNVGLELKQDLALGVQALQESITVRGEAPIVDTTKSEVAAVITEQQINTLPIEGRSAVTLSLLLPGTSTDAVRAQRPGATVGLGGLSTAGTNFIADGMNNMISRAGDTREDIPASAIREFKVIVSQAPAEYGGRVGGVVNVVTKSGSNLFSGQAFEQWRNKSLNRVDLYTQQSHDQIGTPIPDFSRNQFGGAVGGPLIQNRLHFFVSLERTDDREYFTVNTGKPQLYSALEGVYQGGALNTVFLGRGDLQISPSQRAFFRYFKQDETLYNSGGGTAAAFSGTDTRTPGFSYILNHSWVISPRLLNELTVMYGESFQDSTLNDSQTPAQYAVTGSPRFVFPSLSWGASPGTHFRNLYEQFRESLSYSTGNHNWKFGVGAQVLPGYQTSPGNPNGTWTFGTDQPFNPTDPNFSFASLKNPTQFTASFPTIYPKNLSHTYEAYVQDEWKPRSNLTINLGARYDLQTKIFNEDFTQARYPVPLPYVDFASRGDKNNIAPRLGLAWDVTNDGRTVVRGGYGLIYVNLQNSLLDGEITAFQQYSITIKNPSYPDPYQGKSPQAYVSTAPPNISIGANNLVNPPAHTLNAGFSRALGAELSVHVDGAYSQINQFPNRFNVNTPDPVTGLRPLPAWGQIIQLQPSLGAYKYRALMVRLDKRYTKRYLYTLSYTLSKQDDAWTGKDANSNGGITDYYHPELDQGPADVDRRHNFVASGSVLLPFDVSLGAVWTLRSSLPFSAQAGKDLNNDGSTNDYVPGTTKNQGNRDLDLSLVNAWRAQNGLAAIPVSQITSTRYNRVDVKISKSLPLGDRRRLELTAQIFNLLGTDNYGGIGTGYVTNALSDSFGKVLSALPRQQGELAAKFSW